jgi:hypothetical protein
LANVFVIQSRDSKEEEPGLKKKLKNGWTRLVNWFKIRNQDDGVRKKRSAGESSAKLDRIASYKLLSLLIETVQLIATFVGGK